MIIGVTGNYCSGKDTVAEILMDMNFRHVSFSDLLREEVKKRNQPVTRTKLIEVGNELRRTHGPEILAQLAIKKLVQGENFIFTSIRNPGEVELLQDREDFVLIKVITNDKTRLQRIIKRNREQDPKTLEELKRLENIENSNNPNSQQLNKVASMTKVTLTNNGTLEQLKEKTQKFIEDWIFKLQPTRPSWDEYFMNIAESVKLRSNCMSPMKGALIVRDKQIIAAGYNGTPKGVCNCHQGGCPRCKSRHLGKLKSGDYSEPCTCNHAEENSIIQAAYNGASTKDATLYSTFTPCTMCAKMIINAGIKEVIVKNIYPDDVGMKLFKEAGIKVRLL